MSVMKKLLAALVSFINAFRKVTSPRATSDDLCHDVLNLGNFDRVGFSNVADIHDVLDALPTYFDDLKTLRKYDEDGYQIFAKMGGQLAVDSQSLFDKSGLLDRHFLENPPTLRCAFFSRDKWGSDERLPLRIAYLQYLAPNQFCITPSGYVAIPNTGVSFSMTAVWIKDGHSLADRCFVNVDLRGSAKIIRERSAGRQVIPNRKRDVINRTVVSIPSWVKQVAKTNDQTVDEWAQGITSILGYADRPKHCILVRASKDGMTAAWTIDRNDAKRFFAKRDTSSAVDGRRKRVLHYVGEFTRTASDGTTQHVRGHYRGEREFEWNGYQIAISGLGFHHEDFFNSSIALHEVDADARINEKMVGAKKLGKMVRRHYNRPHFLSKRKAA